MERVPENLNKNISRPLSMIKGRKFHGKLQDVYIFQLKCIKAEYVHNRVMCDLGEGVSFSYIYCVLYGMHASVRTHFETERTVLLDIKFQYFLLNFRTLY